MCHFLREHTSAETENQRRERKTKKKSPGENAENNAAFNGNQANYETLCRMDLMDLMDLMDIPL